MYCVYIIYSKNLDSYYVGETLDFIVRLDEHNAGKYQGSYTTKAKDWELFYRLDCPSREVARKIENHIKK
jgi:putative endonuclease